MPRKATIADIARHAGLSAATVDRVLNGRGGVKERTRQTVFEAADALGYLARSDGQHLPARPAQLEFFIPGGGNEFLASLSDQIEDYCARLPLVSRALVHRLKDAQTDTLLDAFDHIDQKTDGVGVVAFDAPRARAAVGNLVDAGLRVVTIASDLPSTARAGYVGIDNRIAGRTAGRLMGMMMREGHPKVAIFLGSRRYRGHEEREAGFRSVLAEHFQNLEVVELLETNEDTERGYSETLSLMSRRPDIAGIYIAGGGRRGVIEAVAQVGGAKRPLLFCHELTEQSRKDLLDNRVDIVIDQNAQLTAEQSIIHLLGALASSAPYLTKKFVTPRIVTQDNIPDA